MKAIITVGVSASGKSTFAREWVGKQPGRCVEVNRDLVRAHLLGGELVWKKWKWKWESRVTEICDFMIQKAADRKQNLIISDTNLNKERRKTLKDKLKSLGYDVEVKVFHVSFEEAVRRDSIRKNGVGPSVIAQQFEQFNKEFVKQYEPNESLPTAVLVDVDGTLAEMSGRGPFEWDKVSQDLPKQLTIDIVNGLSSKHHIVVMSGRDGCCREQTTQWLLDHGVNFIELFMRAEGDKRKDSEVKLELFWENVSQRYNVVGVIDDRPQVVRAWRSIGLETLALGNQAIEF